VDAKEFSSAEVDDMEAANIAAITNPTNPTGKKVVTNVRKIRGQLHFMLQ